MSALQIHITRPPAHRRSKRGTAIIPVTQRRASVAVTVIVLAELFGTSLWFTANGAAAQLALAWNIGAAQLGHLTSAVQLGFITGSLLVAVSGLADRFAASRIFFVSAIVGALANAAFALTSDSMTSALCWRFITGIALAGIYPLGMKLVVGWAPGRRGEVLGWLVGMLVLGTALPHLLQALNLQPDWQPVVLLASLLAATGGLLVLAVGDGPHAVSTGSRIEWGGVLRAFRDARFRAAALGYFGHMWELYALWTIAPLLIAALFTNEGIAYGNTISLAAFFFIAAGAAGCVAGGMISRRAGNAKVAFIALLVSGSLCLVFPLMADTLPPVLLAAVLLLWGVTVVADSPQFSALVAAHAPAEFVGSALAVVNGIGFLITVVSISLLTSVWPVVGISSLWLLAPGPVLGLLLMTPALLLRRH